MNKGFKMNKGFLADLTVSLCLMLLLLAGLAGVATYSQKNLIAVDMPVKEKADFEAFLAKNPGRFKTIPEAIATYKKQLSERKKKAKYPEQLKKNVLQKSH